MTRTSYRSIAARVRAEPEKIKGSRHIATAIPLEHESEVEALLDALRAEFPGACHHAWAWRMGVLDRVRSYSSDDGEPSGSAGRPILQHLEGRDLTYVALVVSRIFGGTKLGVGGLVRAYGGAAAAALDAAEVIETVPKCRVVLGFDYALSSAVQRVLHGYSVETLAADYGRAVEMTLRVETALAEELERELRDATAGAIQFRLDA